MLLPGTYLAYMGEELAMERRIGLFEHETMHADEGDPSFGLFFARALFLAKKIKAKAPYFDARLLAEGLVLVKRRGREQCYTAILNLDGRSGRVELPKPLSGTVLMGEMPAGGSGSQGLSLGPEPLVLAEP
jgi:hypothetical protein